MTIGLVFGVLGLPHVMIRFLTVPNAKQARTSAYTAIWIFFAFYLLIPVLGYGAAKIVGIDAINRPTAAATSPSPSSPKASGARFFSRSSRRSRS